MMEHQILGKPDYPSVMIKLRDQESIVAEAGAMVAMSSNIDIKTEAKGGIFKAAKRSLLGGESFFINTYTASNGPGNVFFSPSATGDLEHIELSDQEIILSTGSFVCSSPSVFLDSKWGGFIEDVDKFDPQFFGLAPNDAVLMTPEERLFLECIWGIMEDAGYTRLKMRKLQSNSKAGVGVFVGCMYQQYSLLADSEDTAALLSNSYLASIANRVSHFCNFYGPKGTNVNIATINDRYFTYNVILTIISQFRFDRHCLNIRLKSLHSFYP